MLSYLTPIPPTGAKRYNQQSKKLVSSLIAFSVISFNISPTTNYLAMTYVYIFFRLLTYLF